MKVGFSHWEGDEYVITLEGKGVIGGTVHHRAAQAIARWLPTALHDLGVNACKDTAHPEKLGELLEACIEPREAMVLDGYERRDVRYCRICQTHISAPIERDGEIVSAESYHRPDCAFAAIGYEPPDKEG